MDEKGQKSSQSSGCGPEEMMMDLRRGPWTVEEDLKLMNYIDTHGEGRWNSLARCAGLKRTGKSCRLRWLNYLRPDVRRGNITLEEQLLILELHSRWGNRWSKIAQHLPGRTDNEIKNYWRTRVQKHAKQLKCDVNSKQFKDTMRYLWMPRLVERIQAAATTTSTSASSSADTHNQPATVQVGGFQKNISQGISTVNNVHGTYTPENSSTAASSDSSAAQVSDITDYNSSVPAKSSPDGYGYLQAAAGQVVGNYSEFLIGAPGFSNTGALDYYGQSVDQNYTCWTNGCDGMDQSLYYSDEFWTLLQQQLNS